MKIVFLDAATVGKDVSLDGLRQFGETVFSSRVADCDIVITNKVKVYRDEIDAARNLKLICVAATGVNCVDVDYAASKGIPVKNVPAYSTESVAQVCFMHILKDLPRRTLLPKRDVLRCAQSLLGAQGQEDGYHRHGQYRLAGG